MSAFQQRKATIYLITREFPQVSSGEANFLLPEILVLSNYFRLVLVPLRSANGRNETLPRDVSVDLSLSRLTGSASTRLLSMAKVLANSLFYKEVGRFISQRALPGDFLNLLRSALLIEISRKWASGAARRAGGNSLFYTWWFTPETLGIAISSNFAGIPIITRAHGIDLYEEYYPSNKKPFRSHYINMLTGIFPDSKEGTLYLKKQYPHVAERVETIYLGVPDFRVKRGQG